MSVWLVWANGLVPTDLVGVFSTKEAAEAYVAVYRYANAKAIKEWPLDQPVPVGPGYGK